MGIVPKDDDHLSAEEIDGFISSPSTNETRRVRFTSSPTNGIGGYGSSSSPRKSRCWLCSFIILVCVMIALASNMVTIGGVKNIAKQFMNGNNNYDNENNESDGSDEGKAHTDKNKNGHGVVFDDDDYYDDDEVEDIEKTKNDNGGSDDDYYDDDDSEAEYEIVVDDDAFDDDIALENDNKSDTNVDNDDKIEGNNPDSETSSNTTDDDDDGQDIEEGIKDDGDDTILNDIEYYQHEEPSDEEKEEQIEEWGHWHFWDGAEETRPTEDYMSMYPNKDCPYDDFPETAWQADAVYVNHMIDSALELIDRAKEAFYTEYGFGPREEITSEQLMTRMKMFRLSVISDDFDAEGVADKMELGLKRGGWTTKASFEGMSRRLLHAMMTNDDFTVVLAGNSAAAGLGNHFQQSYLAQFDYIMRPILGRMGVNLITRNLANGDIGTFSNALGSGSIYGNKIDMIIWDSDLENGQDTEAAVELFYRQALLAGTRPPILMGPQSVMNVLRKLHEDFDAEIVVLGSGMGSLAQTESEEQVADLPQAVRYLNCTDDMKDICAKHQYNARCWIERDDVQPPTEQRRTPKHHQCNENPGFRQHHLKGRMLSFLYLDLLADALSNWGDVTIVAGHPLDGEYWHLTDYYENIKTKIKNAAESGFCADLKDFLPERVCLTPLQARTEFTPRADPTQTSILNIISSESDGPIPSLSEEMIYDGPDVPNPSLMLPKEVIDVQAIVSNRRQLLERSAELEKANDSIKTPFHIRRRTNVKTSKGWDLDTLPGTCDGTTTAICGRESSSDCLLYGHMDHKGGLIGDSSSGTLSMKLTNFTAGLIILKFDSIPMNSLQDDFSLEYAVNSAVTALTKAQFIDKVKSPEKEVDVLTILDDPFFINTNHESSVEFAIQLNNCENDCKLKMTHIYWA